MENFLKKKYLRTQNYLSTVHDYINTEEREAPSAELKTIVCVWFAKLDDTVHVVVLSCSYRGGFKHHPPPRTRTQTHTHPHTTNQQNKTSHILYKSASCIKMKPASK